MSQNVLKIIYYIIIIYINTYFVLLKYSIYLISS